MANKGEFIDLTSAEALKQIKEIVTLVDQGADSVARLNAEFAKVKTPSGNKAVLNGVNDEMSKSNALSRESQRLALALANAKTKEALENAKLRIQLSELNKQNKSNAIEVLNQMNAYQKLSNELNVLRLQTKGLAADMFLLEQAGEQTGSEYTRLSGIYENNIKRVTLLDNALKKIDAGVGQHQRNVGNYASGWDGLGNSINQITREFPAFAVSFQTGVLGLSNNIPILADEISKLNKQNKDLIAQGKPTTSLFSQITRSLLSWQSALSIGVTLITIYAKEIGNFAKSFFETTKAIESATKAKIDFNNASVEGTNVAGRELAQIQQLMAVARDSASTIEQRNLAYDRLLKLYPAYFKEADREKIKNNESTKSTYELLNALMAKGQYEAKEASRQNTLKRINEIDGEIEARRRYSDAIKTEELNINNLNKAKFRTSNANQRNEINETLEQVKANMQRIESEETLRRELRDTDEQNKYLAQSDIDLEKERIALLKVNGNTRKQLQRLLADSLLREEKDKKDKVKMQKDEIDFLASAYELNKRNSEVIRDNNKRIMEDEEKKFADRSGAMEQYYAYSQHLNEIKYNEELRLIDLAFKEEKKRYEYNITQGTATLQTLQQLQYKHEIDKQIARKNYEDESNQLTIESAKALQGVLRDIFVQGEKNIISQKGLDDLRQVGLYLKNISGKTTLKQFADLDNKLREISENDEDRKNEAIRLDLQTNLINQERIRNQLSSSKDIAKDNEALNNLKKEELQLQAQLTQSDVARAEKIRVIYETMANSTRDYFNSVTNSFFSSTGFGSLGKMFDSVTYQVVNDLGEIETRTGSTFQRMWDQASTTVEKFAIAFNAIGELAKETFSFINQQQQARFDAEYERLTREKDIAIEFAGESATAKAEVERQYEERRREIDRRKARAQKEMAIFNAIINTAQAVTAFLAEGNYAGAILAGILGATQIAIISDTQIPEYEFGTDNHPGGKAIVGDGGKHEIVYQPSKGFSVTPKTDTLVDLEKGSKVYPDFNSFLKNSGALLGGVPNIELESNGASASEIDAIMGKYFANITTSQTNIDKDGFNTFISNRQSKIKIMNNNVRGKGFSV